MKIDELSDTFLYTLMSDLYTYQDALRLSQVIDRHRQYDAIATLRLSIQSILNERD